MELNNTDLTLGVIDISLFVSTLAISVLIGVYFANKNSSLEEYMLGGRDQRLLPVAVSMMTSFLSGLTLIGNPAELYYHGLGLAMLPLTMILAVPINAIILLPVFYRLGNVSVFSYLESRFCTSVKQIISLIFMLQMTLYSAVVLYVPSLSLKSILGISEHISIGAVGAACLIYCTLGGIKAVIWTDFFQAGLMYLSLVCIIIRGTIEVGGFSQMWDTNLAGSRLSFDTFLNSDLITRHTLFNVVTGGVIINVFMNGSNQILVQRALSLPSLRLGQYSQLLCGIFTALLTLLSSSLGLVLYAKYSDCDPFSDQQIDKRDAILIYYVNTNLNRLPGLRGIFVAGIFAATLSTLSSCQNSMSALLMEDFIKPALRKSLSEKSATNLSKVIALAFGLACISLTFVVGRVAGLLQVAYTLFGTLGSPIITAYLLGMLTRFVNSAGMLAGMLAGYTLGVYVQFYQIFYLPPLEPTRALSIAGCSSAKQTLFNSTFTTSASTLMGPAPQLAASATTTASTMTALKYFGHMSYLYLPVFAVLITMLVASIVSLFTGGLKQQVDDKYLVAWLHMDKQGHSSKSNMIIEGLEYTPKNWSLPDNGGNNNSNNNASSQLRAQMDELRQELNQRNQCNDNNDNNNANYCKV